ncbi:MAG: DUF423 domain-containing protein, partial [Bryobacteraceae bacterium]|nr:DUF423 domain-containing protein [Bryobacteraceae bacterium]
MVAAILLAVAVAMGAFGAHGLKGRLDAYSMGLWEKAAFYHFIHAMGLLVVSLQTRVADASLACWLLLAGILFFSGSLYALALSGVTVLGAITPLGGTAFIAAWLVLAYKL